jgi:hypothetical protein
MIWTPEVYDKDTAEQLMYTAWLDGVLIISDFGGEPQTLPDDYQSRGVEIRVIGYKNSVAQIGVTEEIAMELDTDVLSGVEIFGYKVKPMYWLIAVFVVLFLFWKNRK